MSTWIIRSAAAQQNSENRKTMTVFLHKYSFQIKDFPEERYRFSYSEFVESLKEQRLPNQLKTSRYFPGENVDYLFEDRHESIQFSYEWMKYEHILVQLEEYNPIWESLYEEEIKNITKQFKNQDQTLLLETYHVGSTSVKGMCAKPIIDILIKVGNYVRNRGITSLEETLSILSKMDYRSKYNFPIGNEDYEVPHNFLRNDATLIKEGFIIHFEECYDDKDGNHFIILRDYLRTHPEACQKYSNYKKELVKHNSRLTTLDYTKKKDEFLSKLFDKATQWYRKQNNYVHIGNFDKEKQRWSCCDAHIGEKNVTGFYSAEEAAVGCYKIGSLKGNYHPGRYYFGEYDFINGLYTCCSQGRYSDGCKRISVPLSLPSGVVILGDPRKWDISSVDRWIKSLKDINTDYSDSFRANGVNGNILLTSIDDEILQSFGISSLLHRRLLLKAVEELKTQLSSLLSTEESVQFN